MSESQVNRGTKWVPPRERVAGGGSAFRSGGREAGGTPAPRGENVSPGSVGLHGGASGERLKRFARTVARAIGATEPDGAGADRLAAAIAGAGEAHSHAAKRDAGARLVEAADALVRRSTCRYSFQAVKAGCQCPPCSAAAEVLAAIEAVRAEGGAA